MREPHFGAVDGAIARALEHGQEVMVFRVEDDALGGGLFVVFAGSQPVRNAFSLSATSQDAIAFWCRTLRLTSAEDMLPRQFGYGLQFDGNFGAPSTRGTGRQVSLPHWKSHEY